jgi:hypothetical protein
LQLTRLKDAIDVKFKGAYVSIDQKVLDALDATIDADDARVARFGDFADVLPKLEADLKKLQDERPQELPPLESVPATQTEPKLATAARTHLRKQEIAVDALADEFTAIDDARATVAALASLDRYMSSLYVDARALEQRFREKDDQTHLSVVLRAIEELAASRRQGWMTEEAEIPAELRRRLRTVDDRLALLWPLSRKPLRVDEETLPTQVELGEMYVAAPGGGAPEIDAAQREAAFAQGLEWLVLVVALAVVLVAAMGLLYIGKPFGTVWDYVTIVTWGLATPTALTALSAALNNLGALTALGQRLRA